MTINSHLKYIYKYTLLKYCNVKIKHGTVKYFTK